MSVLSAHGGLQKKLIAIRSSLWFVPSLVILFLALLALGLMELDRHVDATLQRRWPRIFAMEAEGARSLLSTIATSMATVAGVAFSITVVVLTLASTQYTSRVLRNFMRDTVCQRVLGIFIGIFLYCLLVLRSVSDQGAGFVPSLALLGALVLVVLASGAFILFIHHISTAIQASELVESISRETIAAVDAMYGDRPPHLVRVLPLDYGAQLRWHPVYAKRMGYVQTVAIDCLVEFARANDVIIRMECTTGDFVSRTQPLASLASPGASTVPEGPALDKINGAFGIGSFRTIEQDPAFGLRQLVDMSLKALSPGINDSTTASNCVEHMAVVLAHCAGYDLERHHRCDGDVVRVIVQDHDFAYLVRLAFSQVVENALGNTEIMLGVVAAIRTVALSCREPGQLAVLARQLDIVEEVALPSAKSSDAQSCLRDRLAAVRACLASRCT